MKNEFSKLAIEFSESIYSKMDAASIDSKNLIADHICYRVASEAEYQETKKFLLSFGLLLSEANVNGRPIATFKLNESLQTSRGPIDLLELPSPKKNSFYPTGFEHMEFVLSESFESFSKRHPTLSFSPTSFKILNQEMALKLDPHQVKFHYKPLDRVIEIEDTKIHDIIFDFDGTIIDSKEKIYEINLKVLKTLLGRPVSEEEIKTKFAPEFSKLFLGFGIPASDISKAVDLWSQTSLSYSFELFPQIKKVILELKAKGFRLHLWSARDAVSGNQILKEHQMKDIWESVTFWNLNLSKPEAHAFLNRKKRSISEFNSSNSILIGDSSTDILAAKNLHSIAAAALWDPTVNLDSLISAGAEVFFKNPEDIFNFLQ